MTDELKAPFPWFGGKSRVAGIVWERFGDCGNYVEPFAGSLAVLLARPQPFKTETINDLDCYLANFWRALKNDADGVAEWADWPINEADLHARHLWLVNEGRPIAERVRTEPAFYDVRVAGWWVWGISCWIADGWCSVKPEKRPRQKIPCIQHGKDGVLGSLKVPEKRPIQTGWSDKGVHAKRPNICGRNGCQSGVHRTSLAVPEKLHRITAKMGVHARMGEANVCADRLKGLKAELQRLADRLRMVRVICGDWRRVVTPAVVEQAEVNCVFLDPPYGDDAGRHKNLYRCDDGSLAHDVWEWARENGEKRHVRIALCGYEGEHNVPASWECVPWRTSGGYANQSDKRGKQNAGKERIWFSPWCLKAKQGNLFL